MMKIKPFSAADLLRQNSPRKFVNSNRFASLRDESPAPGLDLGRRFRSPSTKRKPDDNTSYSAILGKNLSQSINSEENTLLLDKIGVNTAKVNSLCEKVQKELTTLGAEPEICTIFNDLCEAISCINNSQTILAESQLGKKKLQDQFLPAPPKKVRQNSGLANLAPVLVNISSQQSEVTESKEEADMRKFREAVSEAEKSTLLFNLNMGKVPIMNQETISKKATLALTSMAAKAEGKLSSTPSDDAITAIDDVLSMTTGMSLFGNSTKSYVNPKDKESGAFCTIPVKYEFKDKDTRIRAETALRARCKVSCATPYPVILRECIRQVVDKVKKKFPGEFVRVNVNANKFSLSVARRGATESTWIYLRDEITLPTEVLNVSTRTVPKDFVLQNLPNGLLDFTPNKPERGRQGRKPSRMEESSQDE